MAAKLPVLSFDANTRVGLEALIYSNMGKAYLYGRIVKTPTTTIWLPEASCAGAGAPPTGFFQAARAATALGAGVTVGGAVGPPIVPAESFPDYAPIGSAVETVTAFVPPDEGDPFDYPFTGATGDAVELWALPDPANDELICYDRGFTATEGVTRRAIPRKFQAVDHYVPQRGENTFSFSDLFVNNLEGISKLKGRDVTLIIKWYANGVLPVGIDYLACASLNTVPITVPGDDNESSQVDAEGTFSAQLRFATPRPAPA